MKDLGFFKAYYIQFICVLLAIYNVNAHQSQVSTTTLIEKENHTWVLQISSSLEAFKQEIVQNYPDASYNSPEEFKALVVSLVQDHVQLTINNDQKIDLSDAFVKLGHETSVVFKLNKFPEVVNEVFINNSSFQNITRNQSVTTVLKKGFEKQHYILNSENNHEIRLIASNDEFLQETSPDHVVWYRTILWVVLLIAIVIVFLAGATHWLRIFKVRTA